MIEYNKDLIKRCLKKDRKAQNQLYQECYSVMMTISWRYTKSKVDAVSYLNAGFLKIIINLKKYDPKVPFEYWMRRVFINEVIDQIRKSKKYRDSIDIRENEKIPELKPEIKLTEQQEEKLDWIKKQAKNLPNKTAQVFNLYAFDGYKHNEIAKMLNMSEGTSQWHYSFAKKQLKEWSSKAN